MKKEYNFTIKGIKKNFNRMRFSINMSGGLIYEFEISTF